MVLLSRTVRFAINEAGVHDTRAANAYAGNPTLQGLGRHYEVTVVYAGDVDARTGYLLDIKTIDGAVRRSVVPEIARACSQNPTQDPSRLLRAIMVGLDRELSMNRGRVAAVTWRLTPTHTLTMENTAMTTVLLRQRFDFAAAHRLHAPTLSDAENRELFGKCNNPSGHGHNYQVEPCVEVAVGGDRPVLRLSDLERLTDEHLIQPFDHKHLNVDTVEFDPSRGGVIPSVENIARVFFDRLAPVLAAAGPRGSVRLRSLTVWETDRTSCTYPA